MKPSSLRATPLLPLVVATACGTGSMHDEDGSAALRRDLSDARVEISRHHEAVIAAPSLAVILDDADRHQGAMDDMMSRMGSTMDAMSHCAGPGMGRMHEQMDVMRGETDAHREALGGASDMPAARAACTAHTDKMNGMIDGMGQSTGNMGCM